jgi:hypothetical protein
MSAECIKCGAPAEAGELGTGGLYVPLCWEHADEMMRSLAKEVPLFEGAAGLRRWFFKTTAADGSRHIPNP